MMLGYGRILLYHIHINKASFTAFLILMLSIGILKPNSGNEFISIKVSNPSPSILYFMIFSG